MDEKLQQKVLERIHSYPGFTEAVDVVRKNSKGNVWLIGSIVYRSVINEMYNLVLPIKDFDFIVEEIILPIHVPEDWEIKINRFGNFNMYHNTIKVDLVPISNIHSIQRKKLVATIENYLLGTPFTLQSIALDMNAQEIIDGKSMDAIKNKMVEINDLEEAVFCANIKNIQLQEYTTSMAENLGFKIK